MEMLFSKGNSSFSGKTVLMLTHDFEPVVDLIYHHRDRFESLSASFLENKQGQLTEKSIEKKDIQTFVEINRSNLSDQIHALHKVIYLRRYFEVINRKGLAFDILSSILHKREYPQLHEKQEIKAGVFEPVLRDLTNEEFSSGTTEIAAHIPDFDYHGLYMLSIDKLEMKDLYLNTASNYEKLHIYRVIFDEKTIETSNVIAKFINQSFHIENDYIYQLNPRSYQMVPQYVIDECDKVINKIQ
jgi:hypothetical protein